MASGLQCWDSSGTLIVDLGDYSCRFFNRYTIPVSQGSPVSVNYAASGVTANNHFAILCQRNGSNNVDGQGFMAVTYNGGITIIRTSTSWGINTSNVTVEVYEFI